MLGNNTTILQPKGTDSITYLVNTSKDTSKDAQSTDYVGTYVKSETNLKRKKNKVQLVSETTRKDCTTERQCDKRSASATPERQPKKLTKAKIKRVFEIVGILQLDWWQVSTHANQESLEKLDNIEVGEIETFESWCVLRGATTSKGVPYEDSKLTNMSKIYTLFDSKNNRLATIHTTPKNTNLNGFTPDLVHIIAENKVLYSEELLQKLGGFLAFCGWHELSPVRFDIAHDTQLKRVWSQSRKQYNKYANNRNRERYEFDNVPYNYATNRQPTYQLRETFFKDSPQAQYSWSTQDNAKALKSYNKSAEIQDMSNKDYITAMHTANGMTGAKDVYRFEVTAKSRYFSNVECPKDFATLTSPQFYAGVFEDIVKDMSFENLVFLYKDKHEAITPTKKKYTPKMKTAVQKSLENCRKDEAIIDILHENCTHEQRQHLIKMSELNMEYEILKIAIYADILGADKIKDYQITRDEKKKVFARKLVTADDLDTTRANFLEFGLTKDKTRQVIPAPEYIDTFEANNA